jgi:uncharacterized membrane protein YoaK (UPF0700 family)
VSAEKIVPRLVPALLSFAAGYVDACTFLALFGLYVAQVTGSFVVFGAGLVAPEEGFVIKVLGIPVFFAAGVLTTILADVLRRRGHSALTWTLALECALLAGFLVLGLTVSFGRDPNAPIAVIAAALGLAAMGVQSAAVRLLLPGLASTNVMTTNTTLFAIDTAEFLLGWHGRRNGDVAAVAQYESARERLATLVPLGLGFFFGTFTGALAFVWIGLSCLMLIVAELVGLIIWAARRD